MPDEKSLLIDSQPSLAVNFRDMLSRVARMSERGDWLDLGKWGQPLVAPAEAAGFLWLESQLETLGKGGEEFFQDLIKLAGVREKLVWKRPIDDDEKRLEKILTEQKDMVIGPVAILEISGWLQREKETSFAVLQASARLYNQARQAAIDQGLKTEMTVVPEAQVIELT